MTYWETILLGVVQGVTEFLPVSSSGHLVLLQTWLGHESENLLVSIALHFGTLVSILLVYRRDLWVIRKQRKLLLAIVVATLPLLPGALFLKDAMEQLFSSPLAVGIALCVTSGLLFLTVWLPPGGTELEQITWRQGLIVGCVQFLAVTPGISRSGSTIVGGLMSGVKKEAATTFSFFIAIPAILGATVLELKDLWEKATVHEPVGIEPGPLLAGTIVACIVGVVSLRALIHAVASGRLVIFAWYCLVVGGITIVICLLKLPVGG